MFFFKIALVIFGPLIFHINVIIILSIYTIHTYTFKPAGSLIGNYVETMPQFWEHWHHYNIEFSNLWTYLHVLFFSTWNTWPGGHSGTFLSTLKATPGDLLEITGKPVENLWLGAINSMGFHIGCIVLIIKIHISFSLMLNA